MNSPTISQATARGCPPARAAPEGRPPVERREITMRSNEATDLWDILSYEKSSMFYINDFFLYFMDHDININLYECMIHH